MTSSAIIQVIIIMANPLDNVCDSELRTFQSYGQCADHPDERDVSVLLPLFKEKG